MLLYTGVLQHVCCLRMSDFDRISAYTGAWLHMLTRDIYELPWPHVWQPCIFHTGQNPALQYLYMSAMLFKQELLGVRLEHEN